MSERDVLVVGGGVIGLAIGYALRRRGLDVTVLDDARAGRAAYAAAGMLAPVSEADHEDVDLVAFGLDSLARYPTFVADVERDAGRSCGYADAGTIWIATNRDEDLELERLRDLQRMKGVSSARLTAAEIREREPAITPRAVGGLLAEGDHAVDPRRLLVALREALVSNGARIVDACTVERIERGPNGAGYAVVGRDAFRREASTVVVATGAWATAALEWPAPKLDFEIRPVKGEVVRLDAAAIIRHSVRTPRVYLVPRDDGELVIGATMEEKGFDAVPSAGGTMDLIRHAWLAVPALYDVGWKEVISGFRPAATDHMPVIDRIDDGLYAALGHYRNGVLLAPATAHYLAEWIATGDVPSALAPFSTTRFRERKSR